MSDAALMKEVLVNFGPSGLVFIIWLIYHRNSVKQFETMLKNQAAQFNEVLKYQQVREEKTFNLLERQIETLDYHGAHLSRIEQKIDSNQYCPMVRKGAGK